MSALTTGFFAGPNGSLHVALFRPKGETVCSRWVIHVPAFGEEMNKSRAMVARQARALAARGMTVLVPDLYGTGDSAGTLEEASWPGWVQDILALSDWARGQGATELTLWGHRLGCLLALEVALTRSIPPPQLCFWQPVPNGKQHMAQFLRLRMAAGLTSGAAETVAQLRQRLQQGETLEVAGYRLPGSLHGAIEALALEQLAVPAGIRVRILEIVREAHKPVLPVTATLVERWAQAGIDCVATTAPGDPFWMTQELGFAPALIEQTCAELDGDSSSKEGASGGSAELVRGDGEQLPSDELFTSTSGHGVQAVVFPCEGDQLSGLLHQGNPDAAGGVVVVVGGPQYRVGSHRQFVYLAQHLAGRGIPVLRFDYRGMGDSSGELQGFEHVNADIRSAIDALQQHQPQVRDVVIWGLCDAATAAVFYAPDDTRVKALVLANPWVYSEQGAAKAYLKHYYLQRLLQRQFWTKVFAGKYAVVPSIRSAWGMLQDALLGQRQSAARAVAAEHTAGGADNSVPATDLVARFTSALQQFGGNVYFLLSGNDLTAAEFMDASRRNRTLRRLLSRRNVKQVLLADSDHTFSRAVWRAEVEELSGDAIVRFTATEST